MIVPMKKIFVVVQKKDAAQAVRRLKDLGVVHPELETKPLPEHCQELRKAGERLNAAIDILLHSPLGAANKKSSTGISGALTKEAVTNGDGQVSVILSLDERRRHLKEEVAKRQALIDEWTPWGDFEPKDLELLSARGVQVVLTEVPTKEISKIPETIIVYPVAQGPGLTRCVLVADQPVVIPFKVVTPPLQSLKAMTALQLAQQKELAEIQQALQERVCLQHHLRKMATRQAAELRFEETLHSLGESEGLAYLKGYCPVEVCFKVEAAAKKESWAIFISDPDSADQVPTLLKNSKIFRLIEPIYSVINVMPGYRELDISPFFLIFFSIFFGLLIGDAGYGAIFFLTALMAHRKWGKHPAAKAMIYLVYVLSGVTMFWGLLTGTVFGTVLFGKIFKPLVPWLTETLNIQMLCLTLGAVHLTFAHVWKLKNKFPKVLGMLSEAGWISLLWSAFFLARTMMLGFALPGFVTYLAAAGIFLVIVDIVAQKQDVGVNLILLVFGIIGAFGDIVSYIRLFAVGLAGVAVADAFNRMAMDIGFHNIPAAVLAGVILIFVHLFLNISLGILGVMVHGIRLNVLEFSSHLSLEWSGIKYDPLKNESQQA